MGNTELIECSRCHYGENFGSEQLLDLDVNLHRLAQAIERDRKRFGGLAEPTPVMMWMSDPEGAYTFFNDTWLEFTGRPLEAERGEGWVAGVHPDDRDNCLRAYRQASGDRKPFQHEYRLRRCDGEYRRIFDTGVPQRAPDGTFLGYAGSCIDITDRRRAEEELLHLCRHLREAVALRTAELMRAERQLQQEIQERLRAREALDRSQKMLQLVTDNIPEAIFWKDRDSVYLGCNRRGAECAGLEGSGAIAGLRDEDLPWGEQADSMRARDRRVMEADAPEYRHIETRPRPGGSTAEWETNRIPLHDNGGNVVGILVTCEDITDRRQTEAQILQTARQLTCVIETVGEGITLSNSRGKFIIYNSKMREITGYSLQEVESAHDFLSLLYPDPQAHAAALSGLYEILERGGVRDVETTIRTRSGEPKTLLVSTSIVENGDDKLFLSSYRDITERKQALDALQITEQEYRSLFENAIEGIFQTTPEGKYLNVNPALAQIYGYATPGELMAQLTDITRQLYVDPDRRDEFIRQLRHSDAIVNFESQVYRADGRIIWISEKARAVKDSGGRTLYYEGMVEDVTDRKRAEQNLRQQAERERLMFSITQRIRRSLKLNDILQTTVAEVREYLRADRVVIYQFREDGNGTMVVESVTPGWKSVVGTAVTKDCWTPQYLERYRQGKVQALTDISTADPGRCDINLLSQLQVKANLVVPILNGVLGEVSGESGCEPHHRLWGLLMVQHCSEPRQWETAAIDFLQQLALQLGIAIQQAELYQQLERLATLDGLTQVPNRRQFDSYLAAEWRRAIREGTPISLILCDVDFFKRYNDTYGHQEGDRCLQEVAQALSRAVRRPGDLVARYGGEEFAVILPNTDAPGTGHIAEAIRAEILGLRRPHEMSPIGEYVSLSLGGASVCPHFDLSLEQLVAGADIALYEAKAQGRDRFVMRPLGE